jgi:hypothetical protein
VRERKREREIEKYCGRYHYYSNQQWSPKFKGRRVVNFHESEKVHQRAALIVCLLFNCGQQIMLYIRPIAELSINANSYSRSRSISSIKLQNTCLIKLTQGCNGSDQGASPIECFWNNLQKIGALCRQFFLQYMYSGLLTRIA